jgi:hypothetical protein
MGVVPGRIRTGFGLARIARRFVGPQLPGPLALIRPQQRARWSVCYHRFPRGRRGWFWTLDDQCTKTLLRSGLARRLCAGGAKSRGSCALNWRSSAAATSRSKSESPSTERTSAPERSRHEFRCCAFDYELAPRPVLTWCWARIRIRNSPCTGQACGTRPLEPHQPDRRLLVAAKQSGAENGRINAWVDRTSRFGWLNSRNRLPKALPSGLVANEKLEFTSPTHESHPR